MKGGIGILNRFLILVWGLVFSVVVVILLASFFSQNKFESGSRTEVIKQTRSLTCESDQYLYPFFEFDESDRKELKIVVTFDDEMFKVISLQQTLYYSDPELIVQSEAMNHAGLNVSFGENGLETDTFEANYAVLEDAMRFGIYGERNSIKDVGMQYFLLEGVDEYDLEHFRQAYENLGMVCVGEDN